MDHTHQDYATHCTIPDVEEWEVIRHIKELEDHDSSSIASDWSFIDESSISDDTDGAESNRGKAAEKHKESQSTGNVDGHPPLLESMESPTVTNSSVVIVANQTSVAASAKTSGVPTCSGKTQRFHGANKSSNHQAHSRANMMRANRATTAARLANPKLVKQLHRGSMMSTAVQRACRGKITN